MATILVNRMCALMHNGDYFEAEIWADDKMRYSDMRAREKWPPPQDDPERAAIVQTFFALQRQGDYTEPLAKFRTEVRVVQPVDELEINVDAEKALEALRANPTTPPTPSSRKPG